MDREQHNWDACLEVETWPLAQNRGCPLPSLKSLVVKQMASSPSLIVYDLVISVSSVCFDYLTPVVHPRTCKRYLIFKQRYRIMMLLLGTFRNHLECMYHFEENKSRLQCIIGMVHWPVINNRFIRELGSPSLHIWTT